jgi:hypothetical protein
MKPLRLSVVALAVVLSQGALAHSGEHGNSQTGPHGGQLRTGGEHHYELVVAPAELTVYVTDHAGTKLGTQGAKGHATVLSGKTKTSVALQPAGDNVLKGTGKFDPSPDMKVVVSVTLPGQPTQHARFTPMETAAVGASDEHKERP